jgi:putative ATPase
MLHSGDDPNYIARRLIRMASEDIGSADPTALLVCVAASEAYRQLGSPEGELMLAQAVTHMACAPKSNSVYVAFKAAMKCAKETQGLMPPKIILNAPTALMQSEGYGVGYIYDPDDKDGFSGQNYFPDNMARPHFYAPKTVGHEAKAHERLLYWARLRDEKSQI